MITTYIIDTISNKAYKHTHFNKVDRYPYVLENRVEYRKMNGTMFTIIEINNGTQLTATSTKDEWDTLRGTLLITKFIDGNEVGLSDYDIEILKDRIRYFKDKNGITIPILLMD